MKNLPEIKKVLEKHDVKFVYFQFVDLNGKLYSITIPFEKLDPVVGGGIGIDGYSCDFLSVEKSDLIIRPDLDTLTILPWETSTGNVASFLCDIYEADGITPFGVDPRNVLKIALKKMKAQLGEEVEFLVVPELQFWLMKRENGRLCLFDDASYFSPPPNDKGTEIRQEMATALARAGIFTEKSHHETTEGKYEVNIDHGPALNIADTMLKYKFIIKNVASRHGLIVSFMPKPFGDKAGNGMHYHQNLAQKGKNLFSDVNSKYFNLSQMALNFIGGQLKHSKALVSVTNPTVNSYKRFHQIKGTEAPSYILWAQYNRTSLIRVPPSSVKAARFEFRGGDGSMNPYLGFAAFLMTGLDGIKNKINPPEPVEENVHTLSSSQKKEKQIGELPWNLAEAVDELEKDPVVKEALGPAYDRFVFLKRKEWRDYGRVVTDWELEKYLDV
jgi:glutamine synthetase